MADPDHLLCLCVPGKGQSISSIHVQWCSDYNMKIHPSMHNNIEHEWKNKLNECSNLFNASKFRLHSAELVEAGDATFPKLKLLIGITSYKDFIGTNCSSYAEKLVHDGMRDFSNFQSYMADPIGVGGLLITDDDNVVFMRRSETCAEMPHMIDRPGGHPEPDVVTSEIGQEMGNIPGPIIAKEIFESVLKEIRDEINIPIKHLGIPILLGIGYNPHTWRRPSLEFYVRCNLKSSDIQELYRKQTQAESEESTELFVIPLQKIIQEDFMDMNIYKEFTHPAKCAIHFLKVFLSQ